MLRNKLIFRFILQVMLVAFILLAIAIFTVSWMFNEYETLQHVNKLSTSSISKQVSNVELDSQGRIVNTEIFKEHVANGIWIQSLDEHGHAIQSFFTPEDVPTQYKPAQLIDYWLGKEPFPYSLSLWIQEKDQHTLILLYGIPHVTNQSLKPLIEDAQMIDNQIIFSEELSSKLTNNNSWVQIFNDDGKEIASWNKPDDAQDSYYLSELALQNKNYRNYGIVIDSEFDPLTNLTWILQYPIKQKTYFSHSKLSSISPELQIILISIVIFLVASIIFLIVLAILFANRFMKPIMGIIESINQLGNGDFNDQHRLSSKRKLFSEVYESIDTVSNKLQASKNAEIQTQQYREEWIAGVTHDMKTPLSSIQGYAHMLASDKYQWSDEEIRSFAAIMLDKSLYMNQLLDDLSLTYRLRSDSLPVTLTKHNINVLLYDSVNLVSQHPLISKAHIKTILPNNIDIYAEVYAPWFERIIYNLIANAVLHNNEHTTITIELLPFENGGWSIVVKDNGKGINPELLERLFERYYRGTSTDNYIEGSGLGMAISKELVKAMKGHIIAHSVEGKGTTITLTWQ